MSWPAPSDRVAALLREGAERIVTSATEEMFARVDDASLAEHDAAVAEDPALLATFRRANRETIVHWATANVRDPGAPVPAHTGPEAMTLARDLVRRGLDGRALEPYRAGQNAAWQAWMEMAFALTDDAAVLHELLAVSARSIFAFVDATMAATYERIARERAELTRGTSAERLEMTTLVLEGAPVEPARASRRLAYELEGTHVAAIAWSAASEAPAGALAQAAQALADAVGAARPLAVPASSAATWAWAAARREPDVAALEAALDAVPDVRLALGERGAGVEGFRRSHRQALVAQRLVARLGSPARVVRHRDVEVVALLTQDGAAADALVAGALGDLATAAAPLRETLRTYLRHGWNATRTAEALFTHRNTVVGRIARAEALLPRPLREGAFEVGAALEILRWRGED